jgi:hypothetical protein
MMAPVADKARSLIEQPGHCKRLAAYSPVAVKTSAIADGDMLREG